MTAVQIPWAPGALFLHVLCRLGEPRQDAEDADPYPDLMTQGGTVTLTCNASRIKYRETDGRQRMLSMREWKFSIRPVDGELFDAQTGAVGVDILSSQTPGLDPMSFTWTATVVPAVGAAWTVVIPADAAGTVDLVALGEGSAPSAGVSTAFVRSVNGVTPDQSGDVVVSSGASTVTPDFVSLELSSDQGITGGQVVPIGWTKEVEDLSGYHDPAAPTKIKIPAGKGGLFLLTAYVIVQGMTGEGSISLSKNGATWKDVGRMLSGQTDIAVVASFRFADGDELMMNVWTAGGSPTVKMSANSSAQRTHFEFIRLGS